MLLEQQVAVHNKIFKVSLSSLKKYMA